MLTRIYGVVTGGRLNLRMAADSSAAILASIPNETLLVVTDHNATWYATTYGEHTGFVMKQFITLLNLTNAAELSGRVMDGALNLRRTASSASDRLIQVPTDTEITVMDYDPASLWYITDYNGFTGYVMKEFVSVTVPVTSWAYGQVNTNELNVRRQPSTSADRWNNVWPLNRIVLVKDAIEGWYESLYRGQAAYVASNYINLLPTPVHASIVDRMLFMVTPELGRDNVE